jgi:hypothetical protein
MADVPCHLYRALRYEDFGQAYAGTENDIPDGLLDPRWEISFYTVRRKVGKNWVEEQRKSLPDVRFYDDGKIKRGGGTSLFDCDGWFGFTNWHYFRIPKGTQIPANLVIKGPGEEQTNTSGTRTGHHYQIEVRAPMFRAAMEGALNNLLRAAIAKNVELAQTA